VKKLFAKGEMMNKDILKGNWKQLKGKVKETWGDLTDDDLDVIAGKRDQLAGRLQERYGMAKDAAEAQIEEFTKRHGSIGKP
jgi:uncharacterized protein YjbJ (UPF0337 family)